MTATQNTGTLSILLQDAAAHKSSCCITEFPSRDQEIVPKPLSIFMHFFFKNKDFIKKLWFRAEPRSYNFKMTTRVASDPSKNY